MITRHSLELFESMIEGAIYRFVHPAGHITLGRKDSNGVRLFGFGNAISRYVGAEEWDRRIRRELEKRRGSLSDSR